MSTAKRYARKQAKARARRRRTAQERLEQDQRQAQRAAEALHHALEELGLPDTLVSEIEGRLRSQHKLLGKIVGVMFPALFGCRTPSELCRVRGWDKNWPSRLLSALPKRSWLKRLRRLGLEVLVPLWRHVATKSAATQSRWQWTWATDDSVFHKYGEQLNLVGRWWSGQQHRVLSGIDGLLLVVVIGDGKLVVPVDFAIRRPDPIGSGAPCQDKLSWARTMMEPRRRRGEPLRSIACRCRRAHQSASQSGSCLPRHECALPPWASWQRPVTAALRSGFAHVPFLRARNRAFRRQSRAVRGCIGLECSAV